MELLLDFDDWYRREYKIVLAAATVASAGDRGLAEDATADAFVNALRKWEAVSLMDSPTGWTVTVAINRVRRAQRTLFRRRIREERHESEKSAASTHATVTDDSHVWEAVGRLTHRQRQALVLRYVEGASQAETAAELDVATGTAAATLHQARRRLHEELTRDGRDV